MRLLLAAPLLLLPFNAFADPDAIRPSMPTSVAPTSVASAPAVTSAARVDPRMPAETGQLRPARVAAPDPVAVDDGVATREHDVAQPHTVGVTARFAKGEPLDGDSDVMAELAAHQMKRHLRALDGCVAAAHKRAPTIAGTVTLDFDVADRKVKSVHVTDDGVHDFQLAACLTSTARSFSFALASARFRWPVAIRP